MTPRERYDEQQPFMLFSFGLTAGVGVLLVAWILSQAGTLSAGGLIAAFIFFFLIYYLVVGIAGALYINMILHLMFAPTRTPINRDLDKEVRLDQHEFTQHGILFSVPRSDLIHTRTTTFKKLESSSESGRIHETHQEQPGRIRSHLFVDRQTGMPFITEVILPEDTARYTTHQNPRRPAHIGQSWTIYTSDDMIDLAHSWGILNKINVDDLAFLHEMDIEKREELSKYSMIGTKHA